MNRLRILNDFAFQKALGEKGDEPQLLAFLNAVLERTGKNNLESVEILEDKDLPAEIAGGKSSKLDVLAKLPEGSKVNIEVQIKNQHNIEKRSLYYWSRKYIWDLRSGEDYIDLSPVIGINIIDFGLGPIEDFHTSYHLWEDRRKDVKLTDVCEIHFLDMVKFRWMKERNLKKPLDRWLSYFDERSPEDLIEEVIKMDSAIQMVQEKLDLIARDPEMFRAYEKYEKAERDLISEKNAERRKGRMDSQLEIAKKALAEGASIEFVSKITGLDVDSVKKLQGQ